jgi:hypothetical protein
MASMRIALRIVRPDHEKELRKASAALPDDWSVEIRRNPGVGIEVRVMGPGVTETVKTFASGTLADVVGYLEDLSRQVP